MKNKKIQIKMIKKQSEEEMLFNLIDHESLLLFQEMMSDRYGEKDLNESNQNQLYIIFQAEIENLSKVISEIIRLISLPRFFEIIS